jgi:hypothetical protein
MPRFSRRARLRADLRARTPHRATIFKSDICSSLRPLNRTYYLASYCSLADDHISTLLFKSTSC